MCITAINGYDGLALRNAASVGGHAVVAHGGRLETPDELGQSGVQGRITKTRSEEPEYQRQCVVEKHDGPKRWQAGEQPCERSGQAVLQGPA